MPLLIDTYNVLHTVGVLPPDRAGIELDGLVTLLAASRYRDDRITLVCDGAPDPAKPSPQPRVTEPGLQVTVRYSGKGKPADELIGQLVRANTAPRRLIVVSSDHQVQRTGRRRRCKILSSHEFLQQLVEDNRGLRTGQASSGKPRVMNDEQIDRWMRVFDLDEQTIAIPADAGLDLEGSKPKQASIDNNAETPSPKVADQANDHASRPPELKPDTPPLPLSLIEQAEQLWRESNAEQPVKIAETPAPASVADEEIVESSDDEQSIDHHDTMDDDLEAIRDIDMSRILPNDGRTKRLRKQ